MTSDLHERLLTATEPGAAAPWPWRVVRAVVELHAPVEHGGRACCDGCDEPEEPTGAGWPAWPCSTVQVIARELGIEVPS